MPLNGNRDIMEELLYNITSLFSMTPDLGPVPETALPWATTFSGFGAVILGKFTGTFGGLTLPLNFSALFIGAIMSNWLLKGLDLVPSLALTTVVTVPIMTWLAMPLVTRLLRRWLYPDRERK